MKWYIPPSVLHWLSVLPTDRPVALLLRHSVRLPLDGSESDYTRPITAEGVQLARALGERIGARLCSLHASPLLRCVQTAEALRDGAVVSCAIRRDHALGDPGVYVIDAHLAAQLWSERGHEAVMAHLCSGEGTLPGLANAEEAAHRLVNHMLAPDRDVGLHVFVTHDSLVTTTVARTIQKRLGKEDWPLYLEAAFFWREGSAIGVAYRDYREVRR